MRRTAAHDELARFEPRLGRAIARALARLRDAVSLNELAAAISARDVRWATSMISEALVRHVLEPPSAIASDAMLRGGRAAAEELQIVLRRRGIGKRVRAKRKSQSKPLQPSSDSRLSLSKLKSSLLRRDIG